MAQQYKTLSPQALELLCGLVRDLACVSDGIDDTVLSTQKTFSSVYIDSLIASAKQSANEYTEQVCNALKRITVEITNVQPTLENTTVNVMYLYSTDGNAPFEQYLKLSNTQLVTLGDTNIALTDYYNKTQADNKFATKTELQGINNTIGTGTLNTTAVNIKDAINEVNLKSHNHPNEASLIKVGEDSDGNFTYGGNPVQVNINIDTSMSNTSTNPVQNKVIKAYIDSHSGGVGGSVVVDNEMSDTSENTVQNKVIKEYVDNHALTISAEDGNALEQKEDGAFVQSYGDDINEIKQMAYLLNQNGIYGKPNDYFFLSDAHDNVKCEGTTIDKGSFLTQFNRSIMYSNNISISEDGYIKLQPRKNFKVQILIFSSSTDIDYQLFKRNGDILCNNKGYTSKNAYNTGNGMFFIEASNEEIEFKVIASGNYSFWSEYSYILVEEIGHTTILDPLETAQDHEVEEVLFESANPQTTGIITLSKDFSEFDYLYFEIGTIGGGGFTVNTTNEIRTDRLVTSSSTNVINLHGWDDCYIEIYKNSNTSITITANKTYGIARIIGKKSKNAVLLNYTANYGDFDKITLFEGEANLVGTYNLSDSISNYKQLYILMRLNTSTGSLRNDTVVIDTDDINTIYTGDAYSRSFSTTASNSRYIGFNFSAGLNKIVVNNVGNATNTDVAIIKIVGIKGHINP